MLNHRLVRQQYRFWGQLQPEQILALGLYRLGHRNSYVSLGPSFINVAKRPLLKRYKTWWKRLTKCVKNTKFPESEAVRRAAIETFHDLSNLPIIVGAIDGSHLRIKAPKKSAINYFSRYQQHDFITQAVVNGQKLFLDFACGFPGTEHAWRSSFTPQRKF